MYYTVPFDNVVQQLGQNILPNSKKINNES